MRADPASYICHSLNDKGFIKYSFPLTLSIKFKLCSRPGKWDLNHLYQTPEKSYWFYSEKKNLGFTHSIFLWKFKEYWKHSLTIIKIIKVNSVQILALFIHVNDHPFLNPKKGSYKHFILISSEMSVGIL